MLISDTEGLFAACLSVTLDTIHVRFYASPPDSSPWRLVRIILLGTSRFRVVLGFLGSYIGRISNTKCALLGSSRQYCAKC